MEAHHDSSAGDFVFQFSGDGSSWSDLLTVTKTADDDTAQSAALPSSTSGTVFVRVKDTDRSKKECSLDTIFVDEMFIRSETGAAAASSQSAATPLLTSQSATSAEGSGGSDATASIDAALTADATGPATSNGGTGAGTSATTGDSTLLGTGNLATGETAAVDSLFADSNSLDLLTV